MAEMVHGSTCIILTQDNRILLQERDDIADYVSRFGGGCEGDETHAQTMLRELKEELGATVEESELIYMMQLMGVNLRKEAYEDAIYFWHDKYGKVTGIYEGRAAYYTSAQDALMDRRLSDNTRKVVELAQERGLLNVAK
jgi:8-oxo-dGTP diphosphatase